MIFMVVKEIWKPITKKKKSHGPCVPTYPYLYADELIETNKEKHASGTYKSLVSTKNISPTPFIYYSKSLSLLYTV